MWIKSIAFLLLAFASTGCALIPPQKIPVDRRNYLDAVSTSWKEQLLSNLVKLRYGDSLTFLELTSINTGYELGGNVSAGFFRAWNNPFWHSLTAGGKVNYLDKPTVTYFPLKGEALSKTVMVPLPVPAILRSLQTGWRSEFIFSCCIESINGLRNHSPSGHIAGDPAFFALAHRFGMLSRHGVIRITVDQVKESTEKEIQKGKKDTIKQDNGTIKAGKDNTKLEECTKQEKEIKKRETGELSIAYILINKNRIQSIKNKDKREEIKSALKHFYDFLKLDKEKTEFEVIDGNRKQSFLVNNNDKIVLQTRSIFESLNMLSEFIELPESHVEEGRAHGVTLSKITEKPWLNCTNDNVDKRNEDVFIEVKDRLEFIIHYDTKPPAKPFVAIKYQDYWFYIDDKDLWSKFIFSGTVGIFSMSEPTTKELTPVLTLPVQ